METFHLGESSDLARSNPIHGPCDRDLSSAALTKGPEIRYVLIRHEIANDLIP